mmetsp:Transcript_50987/g.101866  ORF Transcript_50987/g.101866 Transcript_50987/m.101866 type:complete len:200 (+) Transcript_50987:1090-1689(+)
MSPQGNAVVPVLLPTPAVASKEEERVEECEDERKCDLEVERRHRVPLHETRGLHKVDIKVCDAQSEVKQMQVGMPLQPEAPDERCDLDEEQTDGQRIVLGGGHSIDSEPDHHHPDNACQCRHRPVFSTRKPPSACVCPAVLCLCTHPPSPPLLTCKLSPPCAALRRVAFPKVKPAFARNITPKLGTVFHSPEAWSRVRK